MQDRDTNGGVVFCGVEAEETALELKRCRTALENDQLSDGVAQSTVS